MSCHAKMRTEKLPISEMIEKLQEFMPLKKPFKIKYRKNKQSYSRQDQPTNTTDHKCKPMESLSNCNWMVK